MNQKVSVIVPIYNAEIYLNNALESIVFQSYTNLEILLINDGSTDNSYKICKAYGKKDKRIRVFSQENKGVSCARNLGLAYATGSMITFLDSDDFWERDGIEKLVLSLEKNHADLAVGSYHTYDSVKKKKVKVSFLKKNQQVYPIIDYLYYLEKGKMSPFFGTQCNKLYTRKILEGISFLEGVSYAEDYLFNLQSLKTVRTVAYVDDPIYNYRRSGKNTLSGSQASDIAAHWTQHKYLYDQTKALFFFHGCEALFCDFEYLILAIHETLATGFIKNKTMNLRQKKQIVEKILRDEIIPENDKTPNLKKQHRPLLICYKLKLFFILTVYYTIEINLKYH